MTPGPSPARLLVIGMDAASPALLRQWAAAGELPNVARLLQRGVSRPVTTPPGIHTGIWPSFATGLDPSGHGLHYLVQIRPGTYEFFRPVTEPGGIAGVPFWTELSRIGRRVCILDVPLCRPDPAINGVHVVEWGTLEEGVGLCSSPPEVAGEVLARFGPHPQLGTGDGLRTTVEEWERLIRGLEEGARRRAELTSHFLRQGPWDLLLQVFTETHCIGHQAWHLHDTGHPAHNREIARMTGDPLLRVYRAVDEAVGRLISEAGDAVVVLMALHGMDFWYSANFLLPDILQRLGVLHPRARQAATDPWPRSLARGAWRRLPPGVRNALRPLRDRVGPPTGPAPPKIEADVARSQCFPVPHGMPVSGIRLNIAGREPTGVLSPDEVDGFCDQLETDLKSLVDERTGGPIVSDVRRTTTLYSGPRADCLPDLLVWWSDDLPTGSTQLADGAASRLRLHSPKTGVIEGANTYTRTGEHRMQGIVVAAGPGAPALPTSLSGAELGSLIRDFVR